MPRSYRLGLSIVVASILVSAPLTVAYLATRPPPGPAGWDLGEGEPLGPFALTDQSGRAVTDADLADGVWVASFIFTRCPSSCPKIASVVQGLLADRLAKSSVTFVSISVDPDHDTPAVLDAYAKARGIDTRRWWFLTGPKPAVYDLILNRFKLDAAEDPSANPELGQEAFRHSTKLALVDRGNRLIGYFSSDEPEAADKGEPKAIDRLVARAKHKSALATGWVRRLPALNATLNASCALLLVLGWTLIRLGRRRAHAACMISGVVVSAVFLASYLLYHGIAGSKEFRGTGPLQFVYLTILMSHTLLATFGVVPLVTLTLIRAARRQYDRHAAIARVTFPIWLYVSITGVVIYWMLYQLDVPSAISVG